MISDIKPKRTKEDVKDRLLSHLEDIMSDPDQKTIDRLKSIELIGKEFGMFVEHKKVSIDVSTIVRHFSDAQLTQLAPADDIIDVTAERDDKDDE